MKILNADQMKNIDRRTIEHFGVPSIVLMENAALAVVDVIADHYPSAERAAIFCGPGQNGGDGFAIARHLENRGVAPTVFIVGSRASIGGDARTNLAACEMMAIPIAEIPSIEVLDQALARASQCDLIVDAIFGTGLNRPPEGIFAETIRSFTTLPLPVVAVDVPSGLDASSRLAEEPVVHADVTVAFAQPKIAHVFSPAAIYCGEVVVADISIPSVAVDMENVALSLITPDDVRRLFPPRTAETHKGTYGHVAIVGGSEGRSGAAILSARGSIRSGAGLTTVVTDPATGAIVDSVSIESMTFPFDLTQRPLHHLTEFLAKMSAVLIGPGLPDDDDGYNFVRELLPLIALPQVIDASALNAFAGKPELLNPQRRIRIITPHPGELGRIIGRNASEINDDRIAAARMTATTTGCVVVLKGHQTLIADPDGRIAVNPTGNPGMATGGMGDVLGGMIVSFLAQRFDRFEAACAAVYLHGLAGDLVMERYSDTGLRAMDVADEIPRAIEHVRGAR